jgi:hypothetical protein
MVVEFRFACRCCIFIALLFSVLLLANPACAESPQCCYCVQASELQLLNEPDNDADADNDTFDSLELRVDEPNLYGRILRLAIMESEGPLAAINLIEQNQANQSV